MGNTRGRCFSNPNINSAPLKAVLKSHCLTLLTCLWRAQIMSKKESACAGVQTQCIRTLKMRRPPRPRQFDDPPLSLTPGTCGEAAARRAQPAQAHREQGESFSCGSSEQLNQSVSQSHYPSLPTTFVGPAPILPNKNIVSYIFRCWNIDKLDICESLEKSTSGSWTLHCKSQIIKNKHEAYMWTFSWLFCCHCNQRCQSRDVTPDGSQWTSCPSSFTMWEGLTSWPPWQLTWTLAFLLYSTPVWVKCFFPVFMKQQKLVFFFYCGCFHCEGQHHG